MSSTVLAETQARPNSDHRLSLCVDVPPSSSPFPSPSSSFLPPPIPGVHEFAVKIPPGRGNRKSAEKGQKAMDGGGGVGGKVDNKAVGVDVKGDGAGVGGIVNGRPGHTKDSSTSSTGSTIISPSTPTPGASQLPIIQTQSPPPPATTTTASLAETQAEVDVTSPATTPTKSTINIPILPDTPNATFTTNPRDSLTTPQTPSFSHHQPAPTAQSQQRDSLTSSRPAPPSPSISRRASAAPSTSSTHSGKSRSSRPSSTANLSRANSKRKSGAGGASPAATHRLSQLSQVSQLPSIPITATSTTATPSKPQTRSIIAIKIRDFAFPTSDPRHTGLGPDVPKPNRPKVLNRKLGGGSTSGSSAIRRRRTSSGALSSSTGSHLNNHNHGVDGNEYSDEDEYGEEDEEEEEEDGDGEDGGGGDGWGGFKFGVGRFSWGPSFSMAGILGGSSASGNGGSDGDKPAGTPEGYPSLTDLRNNFANSPHSSPSHSDEEGFYEAEEDTYESDEGPIHDEDMPLYPGLYRALYAFEPEGTAEMALEEDQIVKVVGRGGGVGWAVVEQGYVHGETNKANSEGGSSSGHALVPESYLEVYQLDEVVEDQ